MIYYNKNNIKIKQTFIYLLIWLAYIIIFWTLWNINTILFMVFIVIFITIKVFKINIICELFGHLASDKPIHGIIRCKRCGYPIYRIK